MYIYVYRLSQLTQSTSAEPCATFAELVTTRDIKRLMAVGSILNVPSSIVSFCWSSGNLKNEFMFHPNCGKPSE